MPEPQPTHAWLGIRHCGCFGFISIDTPAHAKANGEDALRFIAEGGSVQREALAEVRARVASLPSSCLYCEEEADA
jgi:hypothetical protein